MVGGRPGEREPVIVDAAHVVAVVKEHGAVQEFIFTRHDLVERSADELAGELAEVGVGVFRAVGTGAAHVKGHQPDGLKNFNGRFRIEATDDFAAGGFERFNVRIVDGFGNRLQFFQGCNGVLALHNISLSRIERKTKRRSDALF